MPTETELLHDVIEIVAEVLGLDPGEVSPEQNFFHDLGGESIDILDLQFRVEKTLGIRISFQSMFSAERWALEDGVRFTAETRERLGREYPFLKSLLAAESIQTPYDLLTVRQIAAFIEFARTTAATGTI
jgi:acyl carrier protein